MRTWSYTYVKSRNRNIKNIIKILVVYRVKLCLVFVVWIVLCNAGGGGGGGAVLIILACRRKHDQSKRLWLSKVARLK